MATLDKALKYAQDASKRTFEEYVVYQSRNGQYLFSKAKFSADNQLFLNSKHSYKISGDTVSEI